MGKGLGEIEQIKKTGTFEIGTEKKFEDLFDVPRSKTVTDIGADGAGAQTGPAQTEKEKAPAAIEDLKDKAKEIPVVAPKEKTGSRKTNSKADAKARLQQAKDTLRNLHSELEAEEEQTLLDEERRHLSRKK